MLLIYTKCDLDKLIMTSKIALKALINQTIKSSRMATSRKLKDPIVWVDCEMTGLDIKTDNIIEICCVITDGDLNMIDEFYESTIYYPKSKLDQMNEWCINTHTASGLVDKVISDTSRTLPLVQAELLKFIQEYTEPKESLLAGNSIHMDKFFMMKEFPDVIDHLHYRLIDVSTIFEIGRRHNPKLMKLQPKKLASHTAKLDIIESIEQLKWFRKHYLKSEEEIDFSGEFSESNV